MKFVHMLLSSITAYLTLLSAGLAADPRATQLAYQPWIKICLNNNANCFVGIGASGSCQPAGGSLTIALQNDGATLSAQFGTRRGLDGPISVQIDQDDPISIANPRCYPTSCVGTLKIDNELIGRLKRSQTITSKALDTNGQEIKILFSSVDFAKVYDRPGSEPRVFEEAQQSLKELQRQRPEEFKQLPPCED
ncbi:MULTISPECIES: invasion associated locus B family protein [Bradyrhizobium]|uniref:invasion associated locus B family protein n=1 Tax=Bradyrhizobium elkanii TaxID=29448 RepID=UPI0004842518|nr:invasion associated locus B family protein [Bradyrhizobium elkanii]